MEKDISLPLTIARRANGAIMGRWLAIVAFACPVAAGAQGNIYGAPARPVAVATPASPQTDAYRLGPGDQIAITYPYNAELNYEGPVGPDGRLTIPLIGSIRVADQTVTEAEAQIAAALRRASIVENARPSLSVRTYGATVYVGGEVRTPGAIKLVGPTDAMRAIILAGGVLETAKSKQIVVIRQMPDGTPSLRYVDLRAYVKAGGVGQDAALRAQDVVFVPRSSIAEVNLWIDQHINRVLPFSRSLNFNVGDVGARTVTAN